MELEISPTTSLPRASRRWFLAGGLVYAFLSGLDWWLTLQLVEEGRAYEANPLAAEILSRYGWAGLAGFKGIMVSIFLGVGGFVWQRRPRTARLLLGFGCGVALAVVGYGAWLVVDASSADHEAARIRPQANPYQIQYYERTYSLAHDIARGKRTLKQATAELEAFLREIPYDPMPVLKGLYNLDRTRCLAAQLVRLVGIEVADNPAMARRQLRNLSRQFAVFQVPLPPRARETFFDEP